MRKKKDSFERQIKIKIQCKKKQKNKIKTGTSIPAQSSYLGIGYNQVKILHE